MICSGGKDLVQFLDALGSKFNFNGHLFPRCGPDHVKYAISLLDAWSNNQNPTLRQTALTDTSEWAADLSAQFNTCLHDIELFSQELPKVYGDKVRQRVVVITLMQEHIPLPQESVRAYANRVKADWRQAWWNLQKHEEVLYDIAWAGLRNSLKNKVRPITPGCGRYDSSDNYSIRPRPRKLHMSKTRSHSRTKNSCNNSTTNSLRTRLPNAAKEAIGHPSPSQPTPQAAANPGNQDQTDRANQAAEDTGQAHRQHHGSQQIIFKGRRLTGKCLQCGSVNHKASFCPKYWQGGNPPLQDETLAPNRDGGHQIKRQ